MNSLNKHIRRTHGVPWRIIEGSAFVVDPEESIMYPLNSVSTRIWELLGTEITAKEIINTICREFEVDEATARQETLAFIKDLLDAGLASAEGTSNEGN